VRVVQEDGVLAAEDDELVEADAAAPVDVHEGEDGDGGLLERVRLLPLHRVVSGVWRGWGGGEQASPL
jgi:hypothetical protein